MSDGHHREAVRELTALIKRFPLDERPVEQLMRTYQRLGQRREALDAFHRLQARLALDSGRAPSARLRRLHDEIQDDEIPVLDQLPADVAHFVGRTELLERLDAPTGATVITGQAGVGKTALAVHWANRFRSAFPGGQLYLNLHGYDNGEPLSAADALKLSLHALGVPPAMVPDAVQARATLFRSLLARRRVLVVLDNAARADQVLPLLVAPHENAVVITSRDPLGSLPDVSHIHLGLLEVHESQLLLKHLLGASRVDAEPEAADELAWACGHLPLALRVVAGELAATPDRLIADAVAELARSTADRTAAALDLAYDRLPAGARTLLRCIGCAPIADVTVEAASALLGAPASRPLATLSDTHFVTLHQPGRYRVHDLVHVFAAARSAAEDSRADQDAALARWLDHQTAAVDAAGTALSPTFKRLPRPRAADAPAFPDGKSASAWLADEHQNLMGAVTWAGGNGFDAACAHLVDALRGCFWLTQDLTDWIRAGETGLAAAERDGDPRLRAAMHRNLGLATYALGRIDESTDHHDRALALFEQLDDRPGITSTLISLCLGDKGANLAAARRLERAIAIAVEDGNVTTQIIALGNLGITQLRLGTPQLIIDTARRCMELCSPAEPRQWASGLQILGWAHLDLGGLERAQDHLHEALEIHSACGNRTDGLHCLTTLGLVLLRAGDTDRAVALFRLALEETEQLGARRRVANALGGLAEAQVFTNPAEALDLAEQALRLYRDLSDIGNLVGTLVVLTDVHLALADPDAAAGCAEEAVVLTEKYEVGRHTGRALHARAAVALARQDHEQARTAVSRALDRHRSTGQRLHEVDDLMLLAEVLRLTGDGRAADEHEAAASRLCAEAAGSHAPGVLRAAWVRTRGRLQPW
ncbi:tetratricopeptide repeat protein [Lentzea tibetensis]|uniref:Tetratricopeptide repeat protein n=1 Tax=Lentzea tibetensis TaxID=2591470 RepID=A0A563EZ36_9PSEU|nr:tetratricopeptide repeat protein [Lentzea tibetensis]TWP53007.1 tetratricopeptide repeat protein [Lentzea tibetensis]